MLQEYETNQNPQKTVNLLKAVQWTWAAWESSVTRDTIKRCWVKSTLIKKVEGTIDIEDSAEDYIVVDDRTNWAELRDQIAQLPIESPLSLDEFLKPEDEVIIDKDENIFTSVVNRYTVARLVKEEKSSDKEETKKVDTAKALKAIKTVKMWKLQKRNSQDL